MLKGLGVSKIFVFIFGVALGLFLSVPFQPPQPVSVPHQLGVKQQAEKIETTPEDFQKEKESRFLDWITRYQLFHHRVTKGEIQDVKFLECNGHNGYGNVIQSVVPCFLFAMITDRVFLLRLNTPWNEDFRQMKFFERKIDYFFKTKEPWDKIELNLDITNCCGNFSKTYPEKFMKLTGSLLWDYFGSSMLVNPYYNLREELPSNWFKLIFDFLFTLKDPWKTMIEEFKAKNFKKYMIGIQMRTTMVSLDKSRVDFDQPYPSPYLFMEAAKVVSYESKYPLKDVGWFLATQKHKFVEEFRKYYPDQSITMEGKIGTAFDRDNEAQLVSFLTWWLLGECDEIISTELSSYGTVAAARSGKIPIICSYQNWCFRKLTPQPCQVFPFRPFEQYKIPEREYCDKHIHKTWETVEGSCGYFLGVLDEWKQKKMPYVQPFKDDL